MNSRRSLLLRAVGAVLVVFILAAAAPGPNMWTADKLRGGALQLVDGQWQSLNRGDVVPDDRVIRTSATGFVHFVRGQESVDLGPNTEIQIFDTPGHQYTTVKQYFGSVAVEAEVRNVQHFAVQTPYLAAVVKGTKFVVTAGDRGASVKVTRGHVQVTDAQTHQQVMVDAGHTAATDGKAGLTLDGNAAGSGSSAGSTSDGGSDDGSGRPVSPGNSAFGLSHNH